MAEKEISTELRLLAAFVLSFVIIIGSRWLLTRFSPPAPQKPAAQQTKSPAPAPVPPATAEKPPAVPAPAASGELKQGSSEQQITVETDDAQIVFSSRGALVKSWSLKGYTDEQNKPLDLVDPVASREFADPFTIWVDDQNVRDEVNNALFVPSATGTITAPVTLTFEYKGAHVAARKDITFSAKGYVVEVKTALWKDGQPVPHLLGWRGGFGDVHDIGMRGNVVDVFYHDPQKITRIAPNDVKKDQLAASGSFEFAGIEDRFFTAAFMPQQPGPMRVVAFRQDISVAGQTKKRPSVGFAVGTDAPENLLKLFVGPKDTQILARIQPQLPDVVDYGWFGPVAKPLFVALRWTYDHVVSNYGWAIILLTIFINFAIFPLKVKSLRSTTKMQKIQPQIRAIQDKYKQYKMNDPRKQQMNTEMMELYKKHGVNPIGGCLPMLLQLPFLYGFYKVLIVSIDMRHAPWIWWVHDLSVPEQIPIRVLPLVMCGTQFILQRMSPSPSPDPAQQKIMMFMPLMFLFLFWNVSSGLVLYWLTGNVVGIVQQWYINKTELQHVVEEKKAARAGKRQAMVRK